MLLLVIAIDTLYLVHIWPDWRIFTEGDIKQSRFITDYLQRTKANPHLPPLRWQPVSMQQIPSHLQRAVIIAEDARFYSHRGIDFVALQDAMNTNIRKGRIKYGASTLSQQTVKNMFLTASRDPLRKWHELVLTLAMETRLSKRRILQTYLNIAEFGQGIYGVEAASRHYWGIPASRLAPWQSLQLAASLPSPVKHNPASGTRVFWQRVRRIRRWYNR